jgi:hypothetical protein
VAPLGGSHPQLKAVFGVGGAGVAKRKRKLTRQEKAEKKRRRREYMTIFINGKQKRVKRPETVEGLSVDEFIRNNADPVWLCQNEMWEDIEVEKEDE